MQADGSTAGRDGAGGVESPRPLRVLLIEDSEADARLMLRELRVSGYAPTADRVDSAAGLADALGRGWDVVLCDCVLPSFSGAEAVAQIRATAPTLPVIAVSGHADAASAILRAGADGFVSKAQLSSVLAAAVRERTNGAPEATRLEAAAIALRHSEAQLAALVDSLECIVWEADPETLAFTFVSEQAERLFGYPLREWLDPDFFPSHVHPDDIQQAVRSCRAATERGENHVLEYRMRTADGRWLWIRDIVTVLSAARRPVALRGFLLDVTAQKAQEAALRASQERFRRLVENANESIALIARDGSVIELSPGNERMLGRGLGDRLGRQAFENVHPDDLAVLGDVLTVPGRTVQGRIRVRHEDGSWRWIDGTVRNLLDDPLIAAIVCNFRDVTPQVQTQQEIESLNRDLERRVLERTVELEAANQELEAFSYSVSHDLRTPLRAVAGFARIVREEQEAVLPETALGQLDKVLTAARRMESLIGGLLDLSRVGRGDVRRRPIDLSAMAEMIVADLRQSDPGRTVHVSIADDLSASADPALVHALLENLLANAWKYTRPRADAEVVVDRKERGTFFVRDNGVGFDMAFAERLFMPFQRLHDAAAFEGSGVGLATVQRIVRRHGGQVWAESAPDAGATFYFTLEPGPARSSGSPAAAR